MVTSDASAEPGAESTAEDTAESTGGGSLLTVVVALVANALLAVAKSVAAAVTGSASMVAEAAHSWSDTGNEVFLLIAERSGSRPRDEEHPRGYGRATYAWSMIAAFGLFTAGAVVGPRDVLMEIVPAEKTLIVEARIRPEDINHVQKGSEAEIRLTAYKQRTTPLVKGSVMYVSGDRMVDEHNGAPYYVAQVAVAPGALGDLRMTAGMPAEVFIRTDTRTALDYLLAPVTNYLRRAMREPV